MYIPFSYANVSSLNQRMNLDAWARTTEALGAYIHMYICTYIHIYPSLTQTCPP